MYGIEVLSIVGIVGVILGVVASRNTASGMAALSAARDWLSGRKTHVGAAILGVVSAGAMATSYFDSREVMYAVGPSAIPPEMFQYFTGIMAALIASFVRLAIAKLNSEQRENLSRLVEIVREELKNAPPVTPPSPDTIDFSKVVQ